MYRGIKCRVCLSSGRTLRPIMDLRDLLIDVSLWELSATQGNLCWECVQRMKNFAKFKALVKRTQDLLAASESNQELQSFSNLKVADLSSDSHIHIDYETQVTNNIDICNNSYPGDNTTNNVCENLDQNQVEIKKETTEFDYQDEKLSDREGEDNLHEQEELLDEIQAFESKPPSDIYADFLNLKEDRTLKSSKKLKKKIKRVRKRKQESEGEVRQKFTTVEFTEEEMVKNREDKRNQPNFRKIPYKCDSCVLGFTRKDTYDTHVDKKHDKKNGAFLCPVCLSRFPTQKQTDRHKRKHYVFYRCKLCKYETLELWSALSHCRTKHNSDDIEKIHCKYCGYVGKTPEELTQHMTAEHSVYCDECGEKFKKVSNLKAHMRRIHAVKREFICDLCSKTFKTKSRLESHMANHNSSIAQKLAYCAPCKIQYKNIYVYRSHLRTSANHAEQTYQCVDCDKRFASKVYWRKHHNFYHLHKSQFRCDLCNKLFISDWRLKNHRQTQHGSDRTRDHRCDECGKLFFTSSTLKGHQLTHSTQRSFMCEDCGDTFKQRPALYTHYRLVHRGIKRKRLLT